ncbi:MAG: acetyl-coenzyme A synthetase, partial [Planctomycetaceae bacterium]|nr:acetyl-coenzyme A synthetase [Planctomycetaceae bacterium]
SHPSVAEAAVVGFPHDLKGEGICCFVIPKGDVQSGEALKAAQQELIGHVRQQIGALATPDQVRFTSALPKTRSGKIMRRLLRDIAAGKEGQQDTTTLEDYTVLAKLREEQEG